MVVLDSTSGHLQQELTKHNQSGRIPVHAMLLSVLEFQTLWAQTTSVSQVNSGIVATYHFYPDDPLWDGQDCRTSSTCCSFNTPPYFTKLLPNPTTDDIEARICQKDNNDDSPVELVELYVQ